jgi:hypothetical protein
MLNHADFGGLLLCAGIGQSQRVDEDDHDFFDR